MIKRTLLSVFIFLQILASGQVQPTLSHNQIDSLQNLLPGSDIKENVDILNTLAAHYAPINFDSSIMYSAQAVRIGSVYGYPLGIGIGRFNTGNAYYFKMDFKNALLSYLSALRILEEHNSDKEAGDVYLQIGNINFFIKQTEKSISSYRTALRYYQSAGDESSVANVYEAISLAMDNLNYEPIDSSLLYGHKLLNYARKVHDPYREAFALMVLGQIYIHGTSLATAYQKAHAFSDSALKIAMDFNYLDLISIINLNLGSLHSYDSVSPGINTVLDLKQSRLYFDKALVAAKDWESSGTAALIYNDLAYISIEEGKFDDAETYLDLCEASLNDYFRNEWKRSNATRIGYSFGKIIEYFLAQRTKSDNYDARIKLAYARGEYQKAAKYMQFYYNSMDTLNAAQQSRQLELLMAEAEAEKTDQKIRMLSQDNELNQLRLTRTRFIFAGGAAGVLIISLFLLLFFQRKRSRAERNSHLLEQKLLRSQMNPHFIFNSLASIQNFVLNQKANEASIYLSRFSQLVRNILDSSVDENVPLQKEVETIENYLELQKVRYAGQFEYSLTVDERIDKENIMIPPMLAQPFIENSIEHGIKFKESPGHIDIRFRLEGDLIGCEVEDDGVGRDKAKEIEMKQKRIHRSMSTSITQERLIKLNKKMKHKIQMEIIDLKDNLGKVCGTRVSFGIPIVEK